MERYSIGFIDRIIFVYINKCIGICLFLFLLDNSEDFLFFLFKKEMSSKLLFLVVKSVLFCYVNEYILLKF